jgi:sodium transport system permease protein
MSRVWWIVFRKELLETLRDRRTLMLMIVVPVLLYPALLVVSEQLLLLGERTLAADRAPVAVVGAMPEELADILLSNEDLSVIELESSPAEALRDNTVTAVAVIGTPAGENGTREVTLLFDGASDRSQRGRSELRDALDAWRDTLLAERLSGRGLPRTFAVPLAVSDSSVALPTEMGGYTLGRILPLLLVVITLLGAFYPAIDLAAGEKERGTLETLLTAPVPASAVVAGKFLTVALIGVIAAALNLGSMLLTFETGMLQMTALLDIEVSLPARAVAAIFLTLALPRAGRTRGLVQGSADHAHPGLHGGARPGDAPALSRHRVRSLARGDTRRGRLLFLPRPDGRRARLDARRARPRFHDAVCRRDPGLRRSFLRRRTGAVRIGE